MGVFDSATVQQNRDGDVFQVNHLEEPFRPQASAAAVAEGAAISGAAMAGMAAAPSTTARDLADEYLREAIPFFNLDLNMFAAVDPQAGDAAMGEQLLFHDEKSISGNATVSYVQTVAGIPVWESGFVVQVEEEPMQVIGAQSTVQKNLQVEMPPADAPYGEAELDPDSLASIIGFCQGSRIEIEHKEPFVYRFAAQRRFDTPHEDPIDGGGEPLALPPVADGIEDGASYVVTATQFTCTSREDHQEGWLALIEPRTGSVLYVRSLAGCGMHATLSEGGTAEEVVESANPIVEAPGDPSVVFFDVGDTLGTPVFTPAGDLSEIVVPPMVLEVLKELGEKDIRIGIISDPGSLSTDLISFLLQDAGVFEYVDAELVHYGTKDSTDIFLEAADSAGLSPQECVFVGESLAERIVASSAGFLVVAAPEDVFGMVDPEAALAYVYLADPETKLGSAGPPPTASTSELNRLRDLVTLRGLTSSGSTQELRGEYVALRHVAPPSPSIPTSPKPGDFRFSVTTNDFGAVNAYHNCDRLFRLLEDFDIDISSYFDGTSFPVPVDHRVRYGFPPTANIVNASAPGRRFPTPRSDGFRFALAARNTTVNMAAAWRVVLHEFGHTCLWDQVGSPNFRFAHSFGDGLAAILSDPGSQAPRHRTFPWVGIGRSHMRPVTDYAWYGTRYEPFDGNDQAGYVAEQMLSSTLFRIYRAAGGDSADRQEQELAARYVAFLAFKAVGLMSIANNPSQPEGYADLMMQADTGTFRHQGSDVRIGVSRKVIRWGFELQGAYRLPPGFGESPTNQVGNPPQVDVFINDGRDGHYFYSETTDSIDIWNRREADGGTVHQDPVVGQENFAFVRVSNRGLSAATNISVDALQSPSAGARLWPDDWQPLTTPALQSQDSVPSGGDVVLGPFAWYPASTTPTLLMSVSATGDRSNLHRFTAANPIVAERVALLDNNVSLRTMSAT